MIRSTGKYEWLGKYNHFIPNPLPPANPPLELVSKLAEAYGSAMLALGKLNEIAQSVPDQKRFIKSYVIKEALLTSAIEGINATLIDVFAQPLTHEKPSKETQLVINYTNALNAALDLMTKENLPLVNRVILSSHKALFDIHGGHADPGSFRKTEVRVGNLIPPPSLEVPQLMSTLEKYINEDQSLPALIKSGLTHLQFETIHPFLDGNGRIGRLLIVLVLIDAGILQAPILYPSYYFKKNHAEYYDRLDSVRTKGDFEGWMLFFLRGIEESSMDAYKRAKDIITLEKNIVATIQCSSLPPKTQELMAQAVKLFFVAPIVRIKDLSEQLGKSYNTTDALVERFVELKILEEITGQKRNKLYQFKPYLEALEREYPE